MSKQTVIALHLGVHKTATTYIQSRLYNSRELLKESSVAYMPLGDVRNLITSKLNKDNFSSEEIYETIKPYFNYDRILLSDENIIGGTNQPKNNYIYPNANERIERLLSIFNNFESEVFITLRNYASYFTSRYAESLRHFPFLDFKTYYRELEFASVSWLDVIEAIKTAGAKKIILTDFNEIFHDEQAYLELLIGRPGIVLESADENPATRRAKFSQQGYEVVKHYAKHYAPGSAKKIMRLIDNTHQETSATPFMPFSVEQQKNMAERFMNELSLLRTNKNRSLTVTSF